MEVDGWCSFAEEGFDEGITAVEAGEIGDDSGDLEDGLSGEQAFVDVVDVDMVTVGVFDAASGQVDEEL